jgi:biopolymer transport protein ExbD
MKLKTREVNLNIPLTHMADIAYLLLIFIIIFSLISTANKTHESLPESTAGVDTEKKGYTLHITEDTFIFDSKNFKDIKSLATSLKACDSSNGVTIIADKYIQFGKVKPVLKLLKEYKFTPIEFLVLKR